MRRLLDEPLMIAVLATSVLGGILLGHALDSTTAAYAVVHGAGGVVAAVAAVAMATRDTFEARLAAVVVATVSGLVTCVTMTIGAPGGPSAGVTLAGAALVACAILIPAMLAVHHRSCLVRTDRTRPYAP